MDFNKFKKSTKTQEEKSGPAYRGHCGTGRQLQHRAIFFSHVNKQRRKDSTLDFGYKNGLNQPLSVTLAL
ncbi:hypothetical protein AOLI_G00024430 [Acnodon oligacanthus]